MANISQALAKRRTDDPVFDVGRAVGAAGGRGSGSGTDPVAGAGDYRIGPPGRRCGPPGVDEPFDGVKLEHPALPRQWREQAQTCRPKCGRLWQKRRSASGGTTNNSGSVPGFRPRRTARFWASWSRPLERWACTCPVAGRAAYPSSVLMNVIPAQVAGVREIVLVTPPMRMACRRTCWRRPSCWALKRGHLRWRCPGSGGPGLRHRDDPAVDKIVGPGNVYVAIAKRGVFGRVGIESLPVPAKWWSSGTARCPDYAACDLLAQAEHDPMAAGFSRPRRRGRAVQQAVEEELASCRGRPSPASRWRNGGGIVVVTWTKPWRRPTGWRPNTGTDGADPWRRLPFMQCRRGVPGLGGPEPG